jgi:hypothetical protein
MDRRSFFTKVAGAVATAVVAPEAVRLATKPVFAHVEMSVSVPVNKAAFERYGRMLAESARRQQEALALKVFG